MNLNSRYLIGSAFSLFSTITAYSVQHKLSPAQADNTEEPTAVLKPQLNPISSYFKQGYSMIPHVDKRYKGGEDACYADDKLLVVLDGVGGWNEVGVDPALFSK